MEKGDQEHDLLLESNRRFYAKGATVILVFCLLLILSVTFVIELRKNRENSNDLTPLQVSTAYGVVSGFQLQVQLNGTTQTINAWRGIPFAAPPLGNLRWASPSPPTPWNNILETTTFKSECLQADPWYGGNYSGSEDCLYLNVYTTPASVAKNPGPWPVLFYIYGGSLVVGAANADYTGLFYPNSDALKGQGLVVVEVAYRLNILGFLAATPLSNTQGGHSGNYGIQDQLMGLQWVQENIRNFNGDPSRVTLAGQSSGGTSIFALLASPASAGLFSGVISMSGSPNITMSLAQAEQQNANIVTQTGCAQAGYTSTQVVSCMRALPYSALFNLIPHSWYTPDIWGLPPGPLGANYAGLCIVDGQTVTVPLQVALSTAMNDVPIVFGNMQCEPDESPVQNVQGLSIAQWENLVRYTFENWTNAASVSSNMIALYAAEDAVNPQKAYDSIVADYGLYCGQIILMQEVLPGSRKSPTYVYYDGEYTYTSWINGVTYLSST